MLRQESAHAAIHMACATANKCLIRDECKFVFPGTVVKQNEVLAGTVPPCNLDVLYRDAVDAGVDGDTIRLTPDFPGIIIAVTSCIKVTLFHHGALIIYGDRSQDGLSELIRAWLLPLVRAFPVFLSTDGSDEAELLRGVRSGIIPRLERALAAPNLPEQQHALISRRLAMFRDYENLLAARRRMLVQMRLVGAPRNKSTKRKRRT